MLQSLLVAQGKITTLLVVGMDEAGQMIVSGPLFNKIVCYGLLHQAALEVERYVIPVPTEADLIAKWLCHNRLTVFALLFSCKPCHLPQKNHSHLREIRKAIVSA